MTCSGLIQSMLTLENDNLKKKLSEKSEELEVLQFQYQSLEEDFMHALNSKPQENALKGKKIVYIGADDQALSKYKEITQRYQAELITPENDSHEAVCQAIKFADEVICPEDCQNQKLCYSARSSCTKYNKPFRSIENSSVQILQQELENIYIQIQ